MKVAVAQISCTLGQVDANLAKIRDFSSRAKSAGAELIVCPEMVDTGYSMPVIQKTAGNWETGAVPGLQEIARKHSIAIISGVSERDANAIYNSQVGIDRNGEIIARYRKTHLFAVAPIEEQRCFSPGAELVSFGFDEMQFGLSICYDLRFPEIYRILACQDNVSVFVISSAWPIRRLEHLRVLVRARAVENQSYAILANRVGTDNGVSFCGNSMIIDPAGAALALGSNDKEELLEAEISPEVVREVRSQMPVFNHRRTDLFGSFLAS